MHVISVACCLDCSTMFSIRLVLYYGTVEATGEYLIAIHVYTCIHMYTHVYTWTSVSLLQWLDNKVVGWLELLYETGKSGEGSMSAHKGRLYHFMYNIYANTRIHELFNMIIEFPESEPALVDLKTCLERTSLRSDLVTSLKAALETRLLHPGKLYWHIAFDIYIVSYCQSAATTVVSNITIK